jgi:methyl-accepting chemotaxis protein
MLSPSQGSMERASAQDSRMSLRNMNIAPRAFPGFALIGALMLFLGVFALNQMSKIRACRWI